MWPRDCPGPVSERSTVWYDYDIRCCRVRMLFSHWACGRNHSPMEHFTCKTSLSNCLCVTMLLAPWMLYHVMTALGSLSMQHSISIVKVSTTAQQTTTDFYRFPTHQDHRYWVIEVDSSRSLGTHSTCKSLLQPCVRLWSTSIGPGLLYSPRMRASSPR